MFRKFLTQQGFTIIQAMMFAGVMAAGALVMTRTITDLKLTQKGAEVRDDLETFHASVVSALQDSKHCTATHTYNLLNPALKQIKLSGGEVLAEENQIYMNNAIKVDKIEYNDVVSPNGSMTIIYSKLKAGDSLKQGYGGKDIKKVVPVNFVFSNAVFSRCYLDENTYNSQTAQEFCTSLGNFMIWDPVNKKCRLKSHNCSSQSGTVFVGIDSNGQEICQKITEAIDTKTIFGVAPVSCPARTNLGLSVVAGQIVILCNPGACIPTSPCTTIAATYCPSAPTQTDSCGTDCGVGTKSSGCACTPVTPCSTIAATYCPSAPSQTDSCGNNCGAGTKSTGCGSPATHCGPMISGIGATCPNGLGTRSQNTYDLLDATNVTVGSCTHDSAAYDCATYPGSTDCPALTSCPVQCNPTTLCPAVAASYCNGAPVQNDSCGNNCGPGTKTSGCGSLTCNWLVTAAPAPACYAVGATVAQPSCATNADCPPVPYTVAGCNETYSFCGCGTPCGSCTPSCLQASDICNGEVCGGANDGCGGACPTVTGTNTGTCFSCAPLSSPTGSNAFCCNGASVVACDASCVPNSAACIGHPLPSCM